MAPRRAFTLIEVIIAVAIIAIMAAMIVPRVTRTTKSEHDAVVERMLDLLSMYAFREATSSQQIALWQDPETQWFTILVAERNLDAGGESRNSRAEWFADRRLQPVALAPEMELADLVVDGLDVSGTDWLIPTVPGGGRPSIEMHIVSPVIDTVLRLDSNAVTPVRMDAGSTTLSPREPRDMSKYGSRGEKW
ncbi:MAG: prepilin-type N-terminal cleavage/methylation domain-containing protein [Phycisphaerales bacterium]|nr:prepilin-type N-terminal cleavage/methylation domain-containing protein [Phycisphaerales bacterium]